MATARKKKASPAQLAARARFAAAAKAGTLRKGAKLKKNPTRSAPKSPKVRKANPTRSQRARSNIVREANPIPRQAMPFSIVSKTGSILAKCKTLAMAKALAQAYADTTNRSVNIRKG